ALLRLTRPHVDEPLVHEAVEQLRLAPPAMRVAVDVALGREEAVLLLQFLEDEFRGCGVGRVLTGERAEAGVKRAVVADRRDRRQAVLFAPRVVDRTAARGVVDEAGALGLGHVRAAGDDRVRRGRGLRGPLA